MLREMNERERWCSEGVTELGPLCDDKMSAA